MRKLFRKKNSVGSPEVPVLERKCSLQNIQIVNFNCRCKVDVKAKCFANLKEGEKVEVISMERDLFYIKDKGFVPQSTLEINIHCYNIYLELLPTLFKDIIMLKGVASSFPKELMNLMLCDNEIGILKFLFEEELYVNHLKGLDTESFRNDTPVIILCKELIRNFPCKNVSMIDDADFIKNNEHYTISAEISNMIYYLYHSINPENCNMYALELTCSFFCLRVICPLFLSDIKYIKNIMKNPNLFLPLIQKIIKNPVKMKIPEKCSLSDGKKIADFMNISFDEEKIEKIKESLFLY